VWPYRSPYQYLKAIELDPNFAAPWNNLGNLLSDQLKRYNEAEMAYRKAVDLVPTNNEHLNRLAWCLFLADKNMEEAEERAWQALAIPPNDLYTICTLACILARRAKWEEAALMVRRFIVEGGKDYHSKIWPDIVSFFREAVKTGHAADAVKLLDDIGYEDRWRPLREALRAIIVGSDASLLRVAPEIRRPAEELVVQLLPEGAKLASAIKTPREQRPRRKKTV
jgi:tetratricopeptide (TPR) repeat protein